LSKLHEGIVHYPQILENVPVKDKTIVNKESVRKFIEKEQKKASNRARILVRPSGTEPLIRIMVEGVDLEEVKQIVQRIKEKIEEEM